MTLGLYWKLGGQHWPRKKLKCNVSLQSFYNIINIFEKSKIFLKKMKFGNILEKFANAFRKFGNIFEKNGHILSKLEYVFEIPQKC